MYDALDHGWEWGWTSWPLRGFILKALRMEKIEILASAALPAPTQQQPLAAPQTRFEQELALAPGGDALSSYETTRHPPPFTRTVMTSGAHRSTKLFMARKNKPVRVRACVCARVRACPLSLSLQLGHERRLPPCVPLTRSRGGCTGC